LPILKNVLLPRTKGFVATVQSLGDLAPVVYDFTIVYVDTKTGEWEKAKGPYVFQLIFRRPRTVAHCYIRRYDLKSLPRDDTGLENWLYQIWKEKDDLLEYFGQHKKFPNDLNYKYIPHQDFLIS